VRALLDNPATLILVLIVIAVFFGPKLPNAAKGIAQSIKVFRKELKNDDKGAKSDAKADETADKAEDK